MSQNKTPSEQAVIKTSYGEMTVAFWPDVAPKTVENFKKLAREGFYDGTAFHRIIKGFMIQGGCPNTKAGQKGMPGTGGPGYMIKAEFNTKSHVKGVLSMARSSNPDSAEASSSSATATRGSSTANTPLSASLLQARKCLSRSPMSPRRAPSGARPSSALRSRA